MRNLALLATLLVACEEQPPPADSLHSAQLTSRPYLKISVAPSTKVDLNATIGFRFTPDEHSSVLRKPDHTGFYIFTAGAVEPLGGALVLETSDFLTFAPAAGYAAPLLYPSHALDDCSTPVVTPFDNNYAAPGSVFPDPSNPGKLLMLYEAENHCPGGHVNTNFYASVGLARSLDADDFGQRWPAPGASPADRYDAIASPIPEPTDAGAGPLGDAIPSGLVSGGYLYAFYEDFPGRKLQVARAIVGDDPLTFRKWEYGWNGTGVGGSGTPIISPPDGFGCGQASVHQLELGTAQTLFLMTMECDDRAASPPVAGWFYSVSPTLDPPQWSVPALIEHTQAALTGGADGTCTADNNAHSPLSFDGWYPSFFSKGVGPGHLGTSGQVIYADGCLIGDRLLGVRTFTIDVAANPPCCALGESGDGCIAPPAYTVASQACPAGQLDFGDGPTWCPAPRASTCASGTCTCDSPVCTYVPDCYTPCPEGTKWNGETGPDRACVPCPLHCPPCVATGQCDDSSCFALCSP